MVQELLCYHPANEGYDAWLGRITELLNAAGKARHPPIRSVLQCPMRAKWHMALLHLRLDVVPALIQGPMRVSMTRHAWPWL